MNNTTPCREKDDEQLALGIYLATIQTAVFFSFILYCAFAASPGLPNLDRGVPLPFIYGLLVIICGTALTAVYVVVTQRREPSHG